MNLTDEQIAKLSSLGLTQSSRIYHPRSKNSVLPLLSISGFSILSLSGLILFKTKQTTSSVPIPPVRNTESRHTEPVEVPAEVPTQVPKSIQHYLLASQTYFSRALQLQSSIASTKPSGEGGPGPSDQSQTVNLINQAILAATEATKLFPQDFRGFEQRARIYQALSDSQPQFIDASLADFSAAKSLNPSSAEISRSIASLYAKKGDAQNTLQYLMATVSLEPTKAQNFYDLAKLQQQTGQIPQALATYNRLLPLLTDPVQITQVSSEKSALENLLSQNPSSNIQDLPSKIQTGPTKNPEPVEGPLLEASTSNNPIIAAPETGKDITVTNQSESNALSGNQILPQGQKQITVTNSQVLSTSQVYLTTTKGGKNQTLEILSKSKGSFTVGLDSPIEEDIEFKYWIIN